MYNSFYEVYHLVAKRALIGGITGLLIGLGIGVSLTLGKIFLFVITSLLPAKHLQSRIFMVSLLIIGGISASSFTNIVTKSDILSILSHSTITVTRVISIIIGLVTAFGMSLVDFESGKSIQKETDSINGET